MKWFIKCLKNYAVFKGRARRAEYWYFVLFQFLAILAAAIVGSLLLGTTAGVVLYVLCALGLLIPSLSVAVRRLHDINRSGKLILYIYGSLLALSIVVSILCFIIPATAAALYALLAIASLAAGIYLLVLFVTPGTKGENIYGPDPRREEAENDDCI